MAKLGWLPVIGILFSLAAPAGEAGAQAQVIGGTEAGAKSADALLAVDFEIEDVDDQGVAGLRTIEEERAGEGIVNSDIGKRIAGLLQGIAETIEGIGFEEVARLEMGDRVGGAKGRLDVVHGGVEMDGLIGGLCLDGCG